MKKLRDVFCRLTTCLLLTNISHASLKKAELVDETSRTQIIPARPSQDIVPNEVWDQILSYLKTKDFIKLRGIDRNLEGLLKEKINRNPFVYIVTSCAKEHIDTSLYLSCQLDTLKDGNADRVSEVDREFLSRLERFENSSFENDKVSLKSLILSNTIQTQTPNHALIHVRDVRTISNENKSSLKTSSNRITNLGELHLSTHLTALSWNGPPYLPRPMKEITKLTQLRELNLDNSDVTLKEINKLTCLKELVFLSLKNTVMKEKPIETIYNLTKSSTNLTRLDLRGNSMESIELCVSQTDIEGNTEKKYFSRYIIDTVDF